MGKEEVEGRGRGERGREHTKPDRPDPIDRNYSHITNQLMPKTSIHPFSPSSLSLRGRRAQYYFPSLLSEGQASWERGKQDRATLRTSPHGRESATAKTAHLPISRVFKIELQSREREWQKEWNLSRH
jgi:hypothetical protein